MGAYQHIASVIFAMNYWNDNSFPKKIIYDSNNNFRVNHANDVKQLSGLGKNQWRRRRHNHHHRTKGRIINNKDV